MAFNDLPLELLPLIIQHLLRPHHLVQVCLVSKVFYAYTVPQLYERTVIFAWHKEGKKKATQLFWTLANCPKLARYVRRLELRDFPKAISRDNVYELTQICVRALANCVNIKSCIWTRDGSIKDDILDALSRCSSLEELEFNGRNAHNYDPSLLKKFHNLRKISVIMPSAEVVHALPNCFERNCAMLQELTIICKFTPVVTDTWLQTIAPSLCQLKKLHLAGCPKITHRGIIELVEPNTAGITDLALEGVSPSFDMKELASSSSRALSSLSSVTLTFPVDGVTRAWLADVESLLFDAHALTKFHLYATDEHLVNSSSLDAAFVRRFVGRHRETLTRFAILRLPMSIQALDFVVRNAENLEQLFISMWRKDLNKLGHIAARSSTLRSLHVTYAYTLLPGGEEQAVGQEEADDNIFLADPDSPTTVFASGTQNPLPSLAELEALASQFGDHITQFGIQSRVWQVERTLTNDETETGGEQPTRKVRLAPYESPDVPAIFLVMRA